MVTPSPPIRTHFVAPARVWSPASRVIATKKPLEKTEDRAITCFAGQGHAVRGR